MPKVLEHPSARHQASGSSAPEPHAYEFAGFTLDLERGGLLRGEEELRVRPKSFELLSFLVRHPQRLLAKNELMDAIWRDTFVTEDSLVQCVLELRRVLGDSEQTLIRTIPRRGYLFAPEVHPKTVREASRSGAVSAPPSSALDPALGPAQTPGAAHDEPPAAEPPAAGAATPEHATRSRRYRRPLLAAAALAAVAAAALLATLWLRPKPSSGLPVLAVLPFATVGPTEPSEAEYLELGLADALITQLGRLPGLIVRPLATVRPFAGGATEPLDAGRRIGADLLVTGSAQTVGERLRVSVHVLRVENGTTLWTGTLEERATDLFAVQDAIGVQIAASLAPELNLGPAGAAPDVSAPLTRNPEAYEHYLRGRILWTRRSREALLQAVDHFERATALDPSFARAHAALGQVMGPIGFFNHLPAAEVRQRMRAAGETAIRLDPSLADGHTALAACLAFHEWRWAEAELEFQRALALNPHDATAHAWYGLKLLAEQRLDEAILQRQRAVALDPLSASYTSELGMNMVLRGDLVQGRELQRQALGLDPRYWRAKLHLAELEEREGHLDRAIPLYREAVTDSGNAPLAVALLAAALAQADQRDEAEALLEALRDPTRVPVVSPVAVAIALGGLGEIDEAFEWLDRAVREGDPQITDLTFRPRLAQLGSDPRYHALLERVGLAPQQVAARSRPARS